MTGSEPTAQEVKEQLLAVAKEMLLSGLVQGTAGIGWRVSANIVQCFAWQCMVALISGYRRKAARWSAFSEVGPRCPTTTSPSGEHTTRSSSSIAR